MIVIMYDTHVCFGWMLNTGEVHQNGASLEAREIVIAVIDNRGDAPVASTRVHEVPCGR